MNNPSFLHRTAACLLTLLTVVASAQEPTPPAPATQPATTQAAAPVNHLRSPYALMQRFLTKAEEAQAAVAETQPAETEGLAALAPYYRDAMACLDFGELAQDPEQLKDVGPRYVEQLYTIIRTLEARGWLDPDSEVTLPKKAATESPHSIGRDPIVLVLTRQERAVPGTDQPLLEWKFSAPTVEQVPRWHANLDELLTEPEAPAIVDALVPERRTPQGLLRYFFDSVAAFRENKDPEAFRAALDCLDFSEVTQQLEDQSVERIRQFLDDEGPAYVADLELVLEQLIDDDVLVLDELHAEPDPDHKGTIALDNTAVTEGPALQVVLVRRGDVALGTGQWRFSADTVSRVPGMAESLRADDALVRERGPHSSPRATLSTFLNAMQEQRLDDAVACLDTSEVPPARMELADLWAGKLWMILARSPRVTLQTVPDDPDATKNYVLLTHRVYRIEIGPVTSEDGKRKWLFTEKTVADIEPLYEEFQSRPIHPDWTDQRLSFWMLPSLYVREYLVPTSLKREVLGLRIWQWIGTPTVLLAGWLVLVLLQAVVPRIVRPLLSTRTAMMLPATIRKATRPFSIVVMVGTWWLGFQLLDLGGLVMTWVFWILRIFLTVFTAAAAFRLAGILGNYFRARAARTESGLDDVLVPLAEKTAKVIIVALGVVFFLNVVFAVEIAPLFAGLGVGGFAVAFAAQDTIKNFFGSVNVVLDRPFQVGDWVIIGDTEGTVEAVGLRSCRIRTFYNSQIVVPNSEIMNATVDNMGRRRYRRTFAMVSVTYDTPPEKLEAFCEGIRQIIRKHPHTRKDYFQVYVNKLAAASIDIILYVFHECPDWSVELRERHRLYLDILRLARQIGVEFAFPTQTVHVRQDAGGPPPSPDVPGEPLDAEQFGRTQADEIIAATLASYQKEQSAK